MIPMINPGPMKRKKDQNSLSNIKLSSFSIGLWVVVFGKGKSGYNLQCTTLDITATERVKRLRYFRIENWKVEVLEEKDIQLLW